MYRRKSKKKNSFVLLVLLIVTLGIGYAFLSQDLTINGTSKVAASSWHIYFDNLVLNQNNVSLSTGDVDAEIDSVTETDITYTVTLKNPGDFYEFTVDVVNDGTIDAMIGSVSSKLGGVEIDQEHPLPSYLDYSVTYSNGISIQLNQRLDHNTSETYKVRLEYKTDITASDLPSTDQTLNFTFGVNYVQADTNAIPVINPINFSTDSWETIVAAVKSDNISAYHVGDTKEIELGNGLGTHTIRIANTSTPEICSSGTISDAACGFVLEFVDILTTARMNPWDGYSDHLSVGNGNVGGWPVTEVRTYLNDTNDSMSLINSLPTVIKNAIIDTKISSGHGSSIVNNHVSVDKLYLLSAHEIWEDVDGDSNSGIDRLDTSYSETRQLDYYANLGVTTSNYSNVSKKNNEDTDSYWWLRSAMNSSINSFVGVSYNGDFYYNMSSNSIFGVSPVFRLAGPSTPFVAQCDAFENDSWEDIVSNAQTGNYSQYTVGCTKKVTLGNGLGAHTIRVANTSTPEICSSGTISDAACGFVLEFADIITNHIMNPNMDNYGWNMGGWPETEMRTYLNDTNDSTSIINSLPTVIKNAIIDTKVTSSHGSASLNNHSSVDKLYLLAVHEIFEDVDNNPNNGIDSYETAYTETRQLDYYANLGITTSSNYSSVSKKYGDSNSNWFLRSIYKETDTSFFIIENSGNYLITYPSYYSLGVSPAFRLAGPSTTFVSQCDAFENDSWGEIVSNVRNENASQYSVGCTKKVTLGNNMGIHTIRVANNSTPAECATSGFSQTGCGFVLEFEDMIGEHRMNPSPTIERLVGTGNIGGWPASEMRAYLNDTNDSTSIINSLPTNLKNAIIDTTVVSSHGYDDSSNFTSTDKLYLLSTREVYGNRGQPSEDTTHDVTRQLDFYNAIGISSDLHKIIKNYSNSNRQWWLRTAFSDNNISFGKVYTGSGWAYYFSYDISSVSPAFRIG